MGNNDEIRTSKPEKPSSPAQDQTNIHVYSDWAAMQAYYGPRVAVPPYFNSAVASGHAPHPYMWGPPQPMMPPYGPPYAAIYAHGGVYAHPGVPLATTSHAETPTKSSGTTDQGLMKKLKGFDGLAMSIGNGNTDSAEDGADNVHCHSTETEGSSDGSNGNAAGVGQNGRKMSHEGTPTIGADEKTETQSSPAPVGDANGSPDKVMGVNFPSPSVSGNVVGTITALELKNPQNGKGGPTSIPRPCAVMSSEGWLQNEKELKRERRKQSNRESARRSRLRKQAEAEELAMKVKSLTAENMTLRSEINRLNENSHKLKLENATLAENLKNVGGGLTEEVVLTNVGNKRPVSTENLLSKVENSGSADRSSEGNEMSENKNSGSRLRQLLKTSPRADAMAAS